jgi:aryl-alcohol dehydrogenase-like predicted oxidoreductase
MSANLTDLSKYIYGTTRLGHDDKPFEQRVQVARAAMDAGVWFHTSHTYGDTFKVLRAAYDRDRAGVPQAIFKIGNNSMEEVLERIRLNLEPLGLDHMSIGQLCLSGQLAEEFRSGGPCYDAFRILKDKGLVQRFVLEVWPWNSDVALDALRAGYPEGIVDGYIFYYNPLQRFVSNELLAEIQARDWPMVAMRTVAGGSVYVVRDSGKFPVYLQERAAQVAPLFEASACQGWVEFCTRFIFGVPQVRATVGSTSNPDNLNEFLSEVQSPLPLPDEIQQAVLDLQSTWAEEHDRHAEPGSM